MTSLRHAGLAALLALALTAAPAFAQSDGGSNAAGTAAADAMKNAPAAGSGADAAKTFELPRVGNKETQIEMITGLCGVQMKAMSKASCKCLAEQSLTGLSDPQRDYLIATVVSPPVADRMLKDGRVGAPDQTAIFAFINATSDGCATGKYDAAKAKASAAAAPVAPAAPAN